MESGFSREVEVELARRFSAAKEGRRGSKLRRAKNSSLNEIESDFPCSFHTSGAHLK